MSTFHFPSAHTYDGKKSVHWGTTDVYLLVDFSEDTNLPNLFPSCIRPPPPKSILKRPTVLDKEMQTCNMWMLVHLAEFKLEKVYEWLETRSEEILSQAMKAELEATFIAFCKRARREKAAARQIGGNESQPESKSESESESDAEPEPEPETQPASSRSSSKRKAPDGPQPSGLKLRFKIPKLTDNDDVTGGNREAENGIEMKDP